MSKVAQAARTAFGAEFHKARNLRGWTLDQLASAMQGSGKSFLSVVEKGKRDIGPRTAGRIITALDLDPSLIGPFLTANTPEDEEATKADRDSDTLLRMVARDTTAPPTAEELLLALAKDFAAGSHIDLHTAFKGLRGALQAAADIKARGGSCHRTPTAPCNGSCKRSRG